MTALESTRARDRLPGSGSPAADGARSAIDFDPLLGAWRVFSERTDGLSRVEIAESGGEVSVHVLGSGAEDAAPDWGRVAARVFTDDVGGRSVWGFRASYDHGYERVELFGYLNRGLLAVEAATTFTDESGRSPYFTRTFMYRP